MTPEILLEIALLNGLINQQALNVSHANHDISKFGGHSCNYQQWNQDIQDKIDQKELLIRKLIKHNQTKL